MREAIEREAANAGFDAEAVEQFGWLVKSLASKFSGENRSVREDLEQLGLVELTKAARAWKPGKQSIATFAYTRVRGEMLNYLSREETSPTTTVSFGAVVSVDEAGEPLSLADTLEDPAPNAEERMLLDERDEQVASAIATLGERDRAIIQMRFYDDFSLDEIAKALTVPKSTAFDYLDRALAKLRPRLEAVMG